jgi:hypothetical protein
MVRAYIFSSSSCHSPRPHCSSFLASSQLVLCQFASFLLPPIALGKLVVAVSILLLDPNPNALLLSPPITASVCARVPLEKLSQM